MEVHTQITYSGDHNFCHWLAKLGVESDLPEIRARLMRNIWAVTPQFPSEILSEIVGDDKLPEVSHSDLEAFRSELLGLWNELSRHRDVSVPFQFEKFSEAGSVEDVIRRVKCRVKELNALMPFVYQGFNADFGGKRESVTQLKEAISASCEHLNAVLELIAQSEPTNLVEIDTILSTIDQTLETSFNRLAAILRERN